MENKLAAKLKSLLEEEKHREAARKIEQASAAILGIYHFAYQAESKALAEVDIEKLDQFIAEVKNIRSSIDTDYYFAAKAAFGGQDE